MTSECGPLWLLTGEWEGEVGLDTSYSHSRGEAVLTPYRAVTVLAGGTAAADAVEFALAADRGGDDYTIGENQYLAKRASALSYRTTITANADGTWSYDQVTTLTYSELPEPFAHTDRNTLRRVA